MPQYSKLLFKSHSMLPHDWLHEQLRYLVKLYACDQRTLEDVPVASSTDFHGSSVERIFIEDDKNKGLIYHLQYFQYDNKKLIIRQYHYEEVFEFTLFANNAFKCSRCRLQNSSILATIDHVTSHNIPAII